ncbi:MAG: Arginine biosynthesis bifunctional protein ArgJ [Deltaproteobacteria bacterium ADurb.Bin510]|nr:MAG: Arginine biosynthesis bifunctional protein ArgJ [Deltaproteobacteria bacterium ADurb.Bin510]
MLPQGFKYASCCAKIKNETVTKDDLGLIVCEDEAILSGVFTTNTFKAAPVVIGMQQARAGKARAVIANSGNANACTGEAGLEAARAVMQAIGRELNIDAELVVPMSTGVIGVSLPCERIVASVPELISKLGNDIDGFATAILTTDTVKKISRRQVGDATVLGMAKGSGMIAPNMATTLAVVLTDARIAKAELDRIVRSAIEYTFNAVTVDGDTSTNDTLLALSSNKVEADAVALESAMREVIRDLAIMIVRDGEGATKLAEIRVTGAATERDAKTIAMSVAKSPLVKTALFGEDPNWGRILAAVGYSGVELRPEEVSFTIGGLKVVEAGRQAAEFDEQRCHAILQQPEYVIAIEVGDGPAGFTVWTTDFSYDYVKINADYRT